MKQLHYGKTDQVFFRSWHEYYYALGFLSDSHNAELHWEHNEEQGAWGSEGRIHCLVPTARFPQNFRFTAGNGSLYARINCNDYVGTLVTEHNMRYNCHCQDVNRILESVPSEYLHDFENGFGRKVQLSKNPITTTNAPLKAMPRPENERAYTEDGATVLHKSFGTGTVKHIVDGKITILFGGVEKTFLYPQAFETGFLK